MKSTRILIICRGNTCRSVMAAALLSKLRPGWTILSAGTEPGVDRSMAAAALAERGLTLPAALPTHWSVYKDEKFDEVLVCSQKAATVLGAEGSGWALTPLFVPDPAGLSAAEPERRQVYRQSLDLLEEKINQWLENTDFQ